MSRLTPLSFPYDQQLDQTLPDAFPYPPIGEQPGPDTAPAAGSANRMQQLEAMLKEVQGRAEIVEKEAYDKAYLAGEKAGMALGQKRAEQILETLQQSLQGVETELTEIRGAFAEAVVDVAGFIAEQIVGDAVTADQSHLWAMAKRAAAQLPQLGDLSVAVSPDDYVAFKRLLDDEEQRLMPLVSDPAVAAGTCRIISSQQDILIDPVAAVTAALEQLRPLLLQESDPADGD